MCFLGVIEVFVVLGVLLVGSVITNLHIINLILYMICWSPKEINIYFWWGEPGMHVDKKGMKSCLLTALYKDQSYKYLNGWSPSYFQIQREVLKNDGGKAGQHWELKLALLVSDKDIFVFTGYMCSWCIT